MAGTIPPPPVERGLSEKLQQDGCGSSTVWTATHDEQEANIKVDTEPMIPVIGAVGERRHSSAPPPAAGAPVFETGAGAQTARYGSHRSPEDTQPLPVLSVPPRQDVQPSVANAGLAGHSSVETGSWQPTGLAAPHASNAYPSAPLAAPGLPEPIRVESGKGTYALGRQVGTGHFGAVYECVGPFDQRYALKVLRPVGHSLERVREAWTAEVFRMLRLRHPNVVFVHDSFEWAGSFCLALEWCDHTLRDMIHQPLSEELVIELTRQMLAAVQYLHDADVVHDDLHPGNVLIQQGDRPIVKIADFGIATELGGAQTVRPEVVHHAIMAPELLAAGYTSRQSDLYQIGLVMLEMISGEAPMQFDVSYPLLVQQISEGVARQRAEQLGTPLGQVIAKMLRRRDAFRYTSAREVWMDLRQIPSWRSRNLFPIR